VKITASATVGGKKSNRVKLHAKRGRPAKPPEKKRQRVMPGSAPRKSGYVVISVSMSTDDLLAMDALASRVQMERSSMIRRAVAHFKEHIEHGNQAQMWKAALR
jgi:hypothetical protein